MKRGVLQTPYSEAAVPTPGGSMEGGGTTGGFDLGPGSAKESPNSVSGLPAQVTTVAVEGGPSGPGTQVPMPPVQSPGTFPSKGV
jgi:hypothetical protein